jgi:pimeloyl-[acyl-carrier protein] methyl ester esterase
MKTYISRREKNTELVIIYGGWGSDENVFTPLCNDDFDFILFYNYSADEAFVLPEIKTYEKVTLIGWSLGVWAAEYLLPKTSIKPDVAIAVNGTPIPADDHYGIPLHILESTLNNITEENMEDFYLRMFGDKKTYKSNIDRIPVRSVKSLHDELRWLYNRIMEQKEPGFRWDYTVISTKDKIFPTKNLLGYWEKEKSTRQIVLPLSHYTFHKWGSYPGFIDFVERYPFEGTRSEKRRYLKTIGL